jgi:hypothetical protein
VTVHRWPLVASGNQAWSRGPTSVQGRDGIDSPASARRGSGVRILLDRATATGAGRDDVSARDVLTIVALISQPVPGEPSSFNRRMIRVFMEGLSR